MPNSITPDDLELDLQRYELRKGGRTLRLEKIPMELLILLVEKKEQLVGREEIVERLWGKRVFVDVEQGINTAIRKIRLVLHDDPEQPRYLQTIVGKGYRFIGPIMVAGNGNKGIELQSEGALPSSERVSPPGAPSSRRSGLRIALVISAIFVIAAVLIFVTDPLGLRHRVLKPAQQIRSIAVLPLDNVSGDISQEYFADGITDALITNLAGIHSLRVISRTSAMHYKGTRKSLSDIARELNVDAIVEGTVLRANDSVRITAQLIRAPSDRHLWANTYQRTLGNVLQLEAEVSLDIAREISATLRSEEEVRLAIRRPIAPEAEDAYLRGRYFLSLRNHDNNLKASHYFETAIEREPSFAAAYAGLADANLVLASWDELPQSAVRDKVKAAISKALAIDPNSSEAHASLAYYKLTYDRDPESIESEFKRALELNPNNSDAHKAYGLYLMQAGKFEQAISEELRAQDVDPLAAHLRATAGHVFYDARRFDQAIQQYRQAIELDPSVRFCHQTIGWAYAHRGMHEEAIKEWFQFHQGFYNPRGWAILRTAYDSSGYKGYLKAQVGREFSNAIRPMALSNYERAVVYAELDDHNNALDSLAKAVRDQENDLVELAVDPDLEKLHSDQRFQDLVRECRAHCADVRPF